VSACAVIETGAVIETCAVIETGASSEMVCVVSVSVVIGVYWNATFVFAVVASAVVASAVVASAVVVGCTADCMAGSVVVVRMELVADTPAGSSRFLDTIAADFRS
jgi:hypothetical protein